MNIGTGKSRRRWKESVALRNIALLYGEIAFIGILNGTIGTYLGIFAIRLGASNTLIGLMSSLPALITVLLMYPASQLVNIWENKIEINKWTFLFTRIFYLPLAFVPYLPNPPFFILLVVALLAIPATSANIAFNVMFIDLIPSYLRATILSNRNMLLMFIQTFTSTLVGYLLDRTRFPMNFQIVMFIGFVASMISLYLMVFLKPIRRITKEERITIDWKKIFSSIWTQFKDIINIFQEDQSFKRFQFATFIFYLGLYIPMPLFGIRMVRELDFSNFVIGLTSTSSGLAMALSYIFWNRIGRKVGVRDALFWSNIGIAVYPLIFIMLKGSSEIIFLSAMGGFFSAGFSVFMYMALLIFLPVEKRAEYLAINGVISNISLTVGPIIGTQLSNIIGLPPVFFIGTAVRIIGTYLYLKAIPKE
ncbi:MAG: MFS transporter [bacterium]|nr:MFS transporter [bacterium]